MARRSRKTFLQPFPVPKCFVQRIVMLCARKSRIFFPRLLYIYPEPEQIWDEKEEAEKSFSLFSSMCTLEYKMKENLSIMKFVRPIVKFVTFFLNVKNWFDLRFVQDYKLSMTNFIIIILSFGSLCFSDSSWDAQKQTDQTTIVEDSLDICLLPLLLLAEESSKGQKVCLINLS